MSSLHMLLPMTTACMHIEDNDEFVFIIPSSKKEQSPIMFGRVYPKTFISVDSKEDLEPP